MFAGGHTQFGSNTAQVVWVCTCCHCTHWSVNTGTVLHELHTCVVPVCWFCHCTHCWANTGTWSYAVQTCAKTGIWSYAVHCWMSPI